MKACLVFICALLELGFSAGPPRPPPICNKKGKCRSTPDAFKWVFCKNEWKRVTEKDCKAVFADPTLEVCQNPSNVNFFTSFPGGPIFLWNTKSNDPNYWFCEHIVYCQCPVCGEGEGEQQREGCGSWQFSKEIKTQGYRYQYSDLQNTGCFNFEAKAPNDVHIALDNNEDDSDLYEIVIGGWGNKLSMVRRGKQGKNLGSGPVDMGDSPGQKGWTKTPNFLSDKEFRGFWIKYKRADGKLEISVGKKGEESPFMTGVDNNPLPEIKFKAVSAFTEVNYYKY